MSVPGTIRTRGRRPTVSASTHSGDPRQDLGSQKQSLKCDLHRRDTQRLVQCKRVVLRSKY